MSSHEPCDRHGDFEPPRALAKELPVQLRWCSCQNTTEKITEIDGKTISNDYFFSNEELQICVDNYCNDDGDPTKGLEFLDRVGWYQPTHHAEPVTKTSVIASVSRPTLTYPQPDASRYDAVTLLWGDILWHDSPVDAFTVSADEEHYGVVEDVHFSGPVTGREHTPFCATLTEAARAQEDQHHRRMLRWRWSDEFMPLPGGGGYGAQVLLGGHHKVILWMRSDPENAAMDEQNTYVYPDAPLRVDCFLKPFLYSVGKITRIIRPGDPEAEIEARDRTVVEIEVGLGVAFEEYLYPEPVGDNAVIEGLVLHEYRSASDLFDRPLPSAFTEGSEQIEGGGVRYVELESPFLIDDGDIIDPTASRAMLLAYGGAYSDSSYVYDVWEDKVAYQVMGDVGVVDLTTGRDDIVFHHREEGERTFNYDRPSISQQYVVARRIQRGDIRAHRVVAKPLSDLSSLEIVLDDDTAQQSIGGLDVYDEWACWGREREDTGGYELVLHNIETGENRVLDDGSSCGLLRARVWGDRAIWGTWCGALMEQRISTGETRTVLENPDFDHMSLLSLWDHYAVFTNKPYGGAWTVYLVDLDTDEISPISDPLTSQDQASIHGGRVVWTDHGNGLHVHIYSLSTGVEYVLNPSHRGSEPTIYDGTIVWNNDMEPDGPWVTRIGDI